MKKETMARNLVGGLSMGVILAFLMLITQSIHPGHFLQQRHMNTVEMHWFIIYPLELCLV